MIVVAACGEAAPLTHDFLHEPGLVLYDNEGRKVTFEEMSNCSAVSRD